jgi:hypothetical protein
VSGPGRAGPGGDASILTTRHCVRHHFSAQGRMRPLVLCTLAVCFIGVSGQTIIDKESGPRFVNLQFLNRGQQELNRSFHPNSSQSEPYIHSLRAVSYSSDRDSFGDRERLHVRRLLETGSKKRGKCKLDILPTDLSSTDGGSKDFGGPQMADDGSIEFFGSSFAIPRGKDGEYATEVNPACFPAQKYGILIFSYRHRRSPSPSTHPWTACSKYPARSKPSLHRPQQPHRQTPATRSSARSPSLPPRKERARTWTAAAAAAAVVAAVPLTPCAPAAARSWPPGSHRQVAPRPPPPPPPRFSHVR